MDKFIRRLAPAAAAGLALLAAAHAEGEAPAQPAAADAPPYRSAFAGYKPWQDTTPGDWRALNDAVKHAPMSGMAMPDAAAPAPAPAPSSAAAHHHAAPAHAGHAMPGGRP